MKIMIDAGHRNNNLDYGAVGNDLKESEIALDIAKRLRDILKANKHEVFMTREGETDIIGINERSAKAKALKCDWLISVHINSFNATSTGVEVCYRSQQKVAEIVSKRMSEASNLVNRGAKFRSNLGVLNAFDKSILVECGFISNPKDALKLKQADMRDKIAMSIAKGFSEALNLPFKKIQIKDDLFDAVKDLYGFNEPTMRYLNSYKHSEALLEAMYVKKPLSIETRNYILKYKFGKNVLERVYGG